MSTTNFVIVLIAAVIIVTAASAGVAYWTLKGGKH